MLSETATSQQSPRSGRGLAPVPDARSRSAVQARTGRCGGVQLRFARAPCSASDSPACSLHVVLPRRGKRRRGALPRPRLACSSLRRCDARWPLPPARPPARAPAAVPFAAAFSVAWPLSLSPTGGRAIGQRGGPRLPADGPHPAHRYRKVPRLPRACAQPLWSLFLFLPRVAYAGLGRAGCRSSSTGRRAANGTRSRRRGMRRRSHASRTSSTRGASSCGSVPSRVLRGEPPIACHPPSCYERAAFSHVLGAQARCGRSATRHRAAAQCHGLLARNQAAEESRGGQGYGAF